MKVILNQDVYNLGEEGDVCEVARGYARNYLLPRKMAVVFNTANQAFFESRKAVIEQKKEEKRKAAMSMKEKLEDITLRIPMSAGDSGKLFGSVTTSTVMNALHAHGIELDKKQIDVPSHTIKMVGNYTVTVKLYEGEAAELKLTVIDERKKHESEAAPVKEPAAEAVPAEAEAPEAEAPEEDQQTKQEE